MSVFIQGPASPVKFHLKYALADHFKPEWSFLLPKTFSIDVCEHSLGTYLWIVDIFSYFSPYGWPL